MKLLAKPPRVDVFKVTVIALLLLALFFALYFAYKISIDPGYGNVSKKKESFNNGGVEVTLLFSPTCPHCIKFHPTFDAVAAKFAGKAKFQALSDIPAHYRSHVEGYPTTVVFKNGVFVDKIVGNVPEQTFAEFVSRHTL